MRATIRSLDPDLPIARLRPMSDLVSGATARQRFNATLLGIFALTALLLASVGLYGVMAYVVSQRTREIGIRMALGGQPSAIRWSVLRQGLLVSLAGLAIGVVLSIATAKAISGLLFGVQALDLATYSGSARCCSPSPSWPRMALRGARRESIRCSRCVIDDGIADTGVSAAVGYAEPQMLATEMVRGLSAPTGARRTCLLTVVLLAARKTVTSRRSGSTIQYSGIWASS